MSNTQKITGAIETLEQEVFELVNLKKVLQAQINDVDNKIVGLESTLSYLKDKSQVEIVTPIPKVADQPKKFRILDNLTNPLTIKDRIKNFVEKDLQTFVTSEFIADQVRLAHYPEHDAETFKNTVSTYLSKLGANKYGETEIVSYRFGGSKRDTVWGRRSWLNEVGEPQKQFFDKMAVGGAHAA